MTAETTVVLDEKKEAVVELTEAEKQAAWEAEAKELVKRYVAPHKKSGRDVVDIKDRERAFKEADAMHKLCFIRRGPFPSAFAIAHTQICDEDPLNIFTTREGLTIINPKITRHTNALIFAKEGCMSYPDADPLQSTVGRWYKIEVEYFVFDHNTLSLISKVAKLKGIEARIFQHEVAHLRGGNVHDAEFEKNYEKNMII